MFILKQLRRHQQAYMLHNGSFLDNICNAALPPRLARVFISRGLAHSGMRESTTPGLLPQPSPRIVS